MTRKQAEGRVALVTGAAGALGGHFAERLALDGCDVVVTDIGDCANVIARVEGAGRRALALPCDLNDANAIQDLAQKAISHFGHVDILVNNAAVITMAPLDGLTGEMLRQMLAVNVEAPFLLAKALIPGMRERGWGRVVNISSGSAWLPVAPMLGYVTTKLALVGLTRGLAPGVANDGITVNAIAPALVSTPGTDAMPQPFWDAAIASQMIRRRCVPEDLVGILSFLCSDDAGFLTGQTIHADAGAVV